MRTVHPGRRAAAPIDIRSDDVMDLVNVGPITNPRHVGESVADERIRLDHEAFRATGTERAA
jgi:hypothetical protein